MKYETAETALTNWIARKDVIDRSLKLFNAKSLMAINSIFNHLSDFDVDKPAPNSVDQSQQSSGLGARLRCVEFY